MPKYIRWGIYASPTQAFIGSDNGLSPDRHQAIIWTNVAFLPIGSLGTKFSQIVIKSQTFYWRKCFWKCWLKISAILGRPQSSHISSHAERNKAQCWCYPSLKILLDYNKSFCQCWFRIIDKWTFHEVTPPFSTYSKQNDYWPSGYDTLLQFLFLLFLFYKGNMAKFTQLFINLMPEFLDMHQTK